MTKEILYLITILIVLLDSYYFAIYLAQSIKGGKKRKERNYFSFISVIVPVYNGESTLRECLSSLLRSDYKGFEVIVVNDGSTDRTSEILREYKKIEVLTIPHAGKSEALNFGIQRAKGEIVLTDADTIFERDTLSKLSRNLEKFHAVSGNLRVAKAKGFFGRLQRIEHLRASMFKKVSLFRSKIDIIPGPIGAFRKEVFEECKFAGSQVEDLEFTLKLKEKAFKITYEPEALAYTRMPENLKAFIRQRFRWSCGNFQLAFEKKISPLSILVTLFLASLDLTILSLAFLTKSYVLLAGFLAFLSFTMIVGNAVEREKLFFDSLIFPLFMWFLDFFILALYITVFLRYFLLSKRIIRICENRFWWFVGKWN
ncbi:MAG: glycosyltransferase [Candidatus Methanofastidiosia archaeon]